MWTISDDLIRWTFFFTTSQEVDTYRETVKSDLSFLLHRRGREIKRVDGFVSLAFLVCGERCVVVLGGSLERPLR